MLKKDSAPQGGEELAFTGERYTPEIGGSIELEHIHRYLLAKQLVAGKTVLDIACGEGYGSALLAEKADHVYGVDIARDAVEHARKRYTSANLEFLHGSCTDIPLPSASIDVIVSFETIEHHAEHDAMLREFLRVLKATGVLVISSPDKLECTDKTRIVNPHHVKELYHNEFTELMLRYFKNFHLYGQRVLHASAIFCENGASKLRNYNIVNDQKNGTAGIPNPMFHIAVASNCELPDIEVGLLEQPIEDIEEIKFQRLITAELADQAAKFAAIKERPLRSIVYYSLRKVYRRFAILQKMRSALQHLRTYFSSKAVAVQDSQDNTKFLHYLSDRRVDTTAINSAQYAQAPESWPEIDISAVTYNSSRWLDAFFTSLLEQRYPLDRLHLHLVDNNSSDDTVEKIETFLAQHGASFAETSLTRQKNVGFGRGHNRALRDGSCKYCLVTNVDLEFLPDSLCNVVRMALADTSERVGSWELRQFPYEHPKHYDPVTLETSWSAHACILIRREAFKKVGGYEPDIFMYAEDVELSYRLRSHGYILKYAPKAAVIHHAYDEISQTKPAQYTGSIAGNIYLRLRYGHPKDIVVAMMLLILTLLRHSVPNDARWRRLRTAANQLLSLPRIRAKKGPEPAYFPFRGFDYELRRTGAFVEARPLTTSERQAPPVSVLIRTYEGRGFLLEQAIRTVFNQTYPAIELIVSEDGGETQRALVEDMTHNAPEGISVRYLTNPKQGRSATGNAALAAATAPYFLFLDDDDLLYSDHVETLMRALHEHPECAVAYALGTEVVTDVQTDNKRYEEKIYRKMSVLSQPWDYNVLLNHNFLVISSLVKRDLYLTHGGLDTELEMLEDWNLWLRYGHENSFMYVPKTTMLFRTPACYKTADLRARAIRDAYDTARRRALCAHK